jgi:hypothetical protein
VLAQALPEALPFAFGPEIDLAIVQAGQTTQKHHCLGKNILLPVPEVGELRQKW